MNRKAKSVLINFVVIIIITLGAVLMMINLKDGINRSEAIRAMKHLGRNILQYQDQHGSVPSQSYVNKIKTGLEGYTRLGDLRYRARWVDFESGPDEILAYSAQKFYSLFIRDGYVVLRLNGDVEWMEKEEFEQLLAIQQSPQEISMQEKRP